MLLRKSRTGLFVCVLALAVAVAACGPTGAETDEVASPAPPTSTATQEAPTSAPPTVEPTQEAVASDPGRVTVTPFVARSSAPAFAPEVYFTTDPSAGTHQRQFPAGVKEIFAIWQYRNMSEGLMVKRVWLRDGAEWLVREEPWDFAKYGANGTIRDVSIHDQENGLPSGQYVLRLYIDGAPQYDDSYYLTDLTYFAILKTRAVSEYPAPGGAGQVAVVRPPGTLAIKDCASCAEETLVTASSIVDVVWSPNGQYILYTVADPAQQIDQVEYIGSRFELWMVDTASGQSSRLAATSNVRGISIAPDGKTIAMMTGSGFCDAGECDLGMHFLKLDANWQLAEQIEVLAFDFANADESGVSQTPVDSPNVPEPGEWQSPTVFKAVINRVMGPEISGIYLLDFETMGVKKVAELTQ